MTRVLVSISSIIGLILLSLIFNSVSRGAAANQPVGAATVRLSGGTPTQGMAGMAGMAGMSGMITTAGAPVTHLDLAIVTGDMIGHTEFPAYVPSDFTLPAHSTVIVTITNFDDATPLANGMERYAKVSGTIGDVATVTPIRSSDPNGSLGATKSIASLNPADVSHTFTIPSLGINVPIAAHAREVFVIQTGAPGHYAWRCFDPCGADPAGWGTAMAAKRGFMQGTLTVQ